MKTVTDLEVENLVSFGKSEKIFSPNEAKTIIELIKTLITTEKTIQSRVISTEEIINKNILTRNRDILIRNKYTLNLNDIPDHFLDKLIATQKRKIEKLKNKKPNAIAISEASFKSELQKKEALNCIFFTLAFVIVPPLIIVALCLFAPPAVLIESFIYFLFFLPELYISLIFLVRDGIEFILGKKIFTEKNDIVKLTKQLASEEELYNRLISNKADRQEETVPVISESTSKNRSSSSVLLTTNNSFFSFPSNQDHMGDQQSHLLKEKVVGKTHRGR